LPVARIVSKAALLHSTKTWRRGSKENRIGTRLEQQLRHGSSLPNRRCACTGTFGPLSDAWRAAIHLVMNQAKLSAPHVRRAARCEQIQRENHRIAVILPRTRGAASIEPSGRSLRLRSRRLPTEPLFCLNVRHA
jgi:hypothetical protein